MKLPSQRHLFDIPDDVAYLNCAYMGPLSHAVQEAGVRGLRQKATPWQITVPDFFDPPNALRAAFAELIHAGPEDIAITASASYGLSTAAKNLPLASGQTVLIVTEQFPSNVYPWRERAAEVGASVRTLDRPADDDWTKTVLEAIDASTAIVAVPQCHWTDGGLFDLEQISDACRERSIALAVDATQTAGAYPIDVRRIQPDFLTSATYKWLLGPYSLGLLYVSKKWQERGVPIEHNWADRKGAAQFSRLVDYQDEYEAGAVRFDVGEKSNFALVPAALAGIQQLLDWGVDNIQETIRALTNAIADQAREIGLESVPAERRAGHYLGLRMKSGVPEDVAAELSKRKIYVSIRGPSVRVTPHVYNTEADAGRLIEALREILG